MIGAVIVTFEPGIGSLTELLCALSPQVDQLYIVDNSPRDDDTVFVIVSRIEVCRDKAHVIRFGDNLGIAAALNVGIEQAIRDRADFVLLSDQDSTPAGNMVEALRCESKLICSQGVNLGAIGPTFTDLNAGVVSKFQVSVPGRWFYGHRTPGPTVPNVEALTLITSGLLIPVPVLHSVGLMREDLFIDHVDTEWSHRARSKGYRLYGTWHAKMVHRMGENESLRVWYFGWRNESYYKPERLYYRIRNLFVLLRSDSIELGWKVRTCWYSLGLIYSHIVFGHASLVSLKMVARGFWDGLRQKLGPYSP